MTTKKFNSIVRMGILFLSCTAILASCTPETEENNEPKYTMGDPKNTSPQGSRCFELTEFTVLGEDQASTYSDIRWEFKNNGTVIARSTSQEWSGSWNIGFNEGTQQFILDFEGAPPFINAVSGIRSVVSLDLDNPQFMDDEGDVLQFTSAECAPLSPELETLNAFLLDSLFSISNFIYQDNDVTDVFSNVTLNFNENHQVIVERFGQQRTGQWLTGETEDGITLTLQFNSPPTQLTGFNGVWDVVSFGISGIVLEYVDGPPDTGSFYTIELVNAN